MDRPDSQKRQNKVQDIDEAAGVVRRFNRFYTKRIGVLQDGFLRSPFSLAEGRVLYELAHRENATAGDVGKELELDRGYLSRILRSFEQRGFIERTPSEIDGRQTLLSLTPQGFEALAPLDQRSHDETVAMLRRLSAVEQCRLIESMHAIETALGDAPPARVPYILRPHQPGDMGWIIHRHGVLYAQEYGWDERCEALIAEIASKFIEQHDPRRERCWIAEREGKILGSVLLVRQSDDVAQLRLLLVEPSARGLGIGHRLVNECVAFARRANYKAITLWTNDVLHAARRIYEEAGFHLVGEEHHHSFGHDLVGQNWTLELSGPVPSAQMGLTQKA